MTYGRPGVYINERLLPAPLTASGTATAAGAALGAFAKGPSELTLVNSWYDFVKLYGSYDAAYPATFGIGQYFANGGTELYVRRVFPSNAVKASKVITNSAGSTDVVTVTSKGVGTSGNLLRVQLTQGRAVTGTAYYYYTFTVYEESGASGASGDILLERYTDIRLDSTSSSDFLETVVNLTSKFVTVDVTSLTEAPKTDYLSLVSGTNGTGLDDGDFSAALEDLEVVDRPLVVFFPEVCHADALGASVGGDAQAALVSWVSTNTSAFAILDTPADVAVADAITYADDNAFETVSNAALYYPNVYISDPVGRSSVSIRKIGAAGTVAGLYLSTDRNVGPFRAPAGLRNALNGVVAIERMFTSAELDSLNTADVPVNAIRNIPGAGVVVMGARTLLQDGTANRYVNMRRSLIYIKKRLSDLTEFALFENNDANLWKQLRATVSAFLNEYRNQGGLRGDTPDAAYYVKVDAENNPSSSIEQGEVNIEVGVALQYPAEFIVINLSQKTGQ
jgi:phage tail sheath protein FI